MTKFAIANVLLHLEVALQVKHGMQINASAYVELQSEDALEESDGILWRVNANVLIESNFVLKVKHGIKTNVNACVLLQP